MSLLASEHQRVVLMQKAERLLELHHDPKLLVLPNIWDPLGARLLESMGFPAVATASAAVAFSKGYDDGEKIRLDVMLDVIEQIAASVSIPLTVDVEGGYADKPDAVAENIRRVLEAGAVGINLEDSRAEDRALRSIEEQCARIQAVRKMAVRESVPLVINARTDVFLRESGDPAKVRFAETLSRSRAFLDAGADCIYPIGLGNLEMLEALRGELRAPINVYAAASAPGMRELEQAGISRLSLGPGLIRASLDRMREVARALQAYGSYESFTQNVMTSGEIREIVAKGNMP